MPPLVAPPPRTGEAAQGLETAEPSAATDRAATPPDQPAEPTHPLPAAAARTAAAGVFLALLAAAFAGVAVLVVLVVRMLAAGADHLDTSGPPLVVLAVGFALGNAAALLLVTRGWARLRPTTLVPAMIAAVAWPLSGHALLAAPVAILLVGLLVDRDRRTPEGLRLTSLTGALALATLALFATAAGAITSSATVRQAPAERATTGDEDTATSVEGAPPRGADKAPRGADDVPPPAPSPAPRAAAPARPSAEDFVRGYYRDLDAQRFAEAWRTLSPGVQAALGPYARWKAGYAQTISSRPRGLTVSRSRTGTTVTHILVARNKGCDSTRRFSVTWRLRAEGSGWTVERLGATVAGPQEC